MSDEKPQLPDPQELKRLNELLLRLSARLESSNLAEFADLLTRPGKLIWTNFLAGLSRGVGMFLGAGVMGALTLGLLSWGIYHLLHVFNMIPWLHDVTAILTDLANTFIREHKKK